MHLGILEGYNDSVATESECMDYLGDWSRVSTA